MNRREVSDQILLESISPERRLIERLEKVEAALQKKIEESLEMIDRVDQILDTLNNIPAKPKGESNVK